MPKQVGDLVQLLDGKWVRLGPARCPNGHELGGRRFYGMPKRCIWHNDGHLEWECPQCGALMHHPAWEPHCREAVGIGDRDRQARDA